MTSAESVTVRGAQRPRSLRLRLTVLFAVVTSLAIGALGIYLDYALAGQLAARQQEELHGKLELFRHLLTELPDRRAIVLERHRFADAMVGHGELYAEVLDESGVPIVKLSPFDFPAALVRAAASGTAVSETVRVAGEPFRVLVAPAPLGKGVDAVVVGIAHDTAEARQILARFRTTILIACALGTILAGGLAYFAAVRGLRPLRKMVDAAARISAERLDERLASADVPLELRDLADSFNAMLSRLENSFKRLSDFSSDLAHELRTPIGNLMLHSQVALDRPRSESELRHVLESGLEELGRLSRLVNDMLFLAKADHAQLKLKRETVPLEQEVAKVFEYFEPLAAERKVQLVCNGVGTIAADRSMIRRALANVVSNAVRHAVVASIVNVAVKRERATVVVEITNRGAALSAEDCDRVFDRFFRAESSRSEPTDGAGLGLAIVKSIVELHEGKVSAGSYAEHTFFRIELPVSAASA